MKGAAGSAPPLVRARNRVARASRVHGRTALRASARPGALERMRGFPQSAQDPEKGQSFFGRESREHQVL
jgi:hypothetical protein